MAYSESVNRHEQRIVALENQVKVLMQTRSLGNPSEATEDGCHANAEEPERNREKAHPAGVKETRRERHGRLWYETECRRHNVSFDWSDTIEQEYFMRLAERFVATAGLVPLAIVREIVRSGHPGRYASGSLAFRDAWELKERDILDGLSASFGADE